ncbi:MAG: hypothetical protein K9K38_10420 [Rhodoferax sp.]|nr:hypothetical protein [Rhodoferax sp.]
MVRARQQVLREHGGAAILAETRSIMTAMASFRRTGKVEGFRDLKYVCLGMGVVDGEGWCVLADVRLRNRVAELVEAQPEMRRRIRCFQALLSSFWSFPLNGKQASAESKAGWVDLRKWLRAERERILKSKEQKPPWFAALTKHITLLSEQPCERFGAALLRGDSSELREAMDSLAIPSDSWVVEEAVIAQMRAGCALNDEPFKVTLFNLINIGSGRGGVELGESLRIRSVSLLVSRYAKCRERPEHMALRDAAVGIVGNPWLRRASWDAWVVDARGKPDDQSREMVNGWLKRELIKNFFELLSVDGTGDSRRVDYWLRFEPSIDEMWFALGADAQYQRGEAFMDFKSRAKGRLLDLDGTTADNNAFVMRVGRYLLVEFGAKGNAMYVFEWDALGQPLLDTLTSGRARASVSIHRLKDSNNVERLIHRDSAAQSWEQKFDAYLVPRIGRRPSDPPRRAGAVRRVRNEGFSPDTWSFFARTHGLRVEDHRSRQGALWVLGDEQPSHVVSQLVAWGFKLRRPRGWFKE